MKRKAKQTINYLKFTAIIDIIFSKRFELKNFYPDGTLKSETKFDRKEIIDNLK